MRKKSAQQIRSRDEATRGLERKCVCPRFVVPFSSFFVRAALRVVALWCVASGLALGQAPGQSARSIIESLNYQTSRAAHREGIATCGSIGTVFMENRAIADSLVKLGDEASPEIERALNSVQNEGPNSPFNPSAGYLGYAYARIKGPTAYRLLRALINSPVSNGLRFAYTDSISVSFGLTSYVDSSVDFTPGGCKQPEPRDGLNQFISGWEGDIRSRVDASLGVQARSALKRLLKGKTWAALRSELWHGKIPSYVAVGYKLIIQGPWSEPLETVDLNQVVDLARFPRDPQIDTAFSDGSGHRCRSYAVEFKRVETSFLPKYAVDNSDLDGLLRVISACATDVNSGPF